MQIPQLKLKQNGNNNILTSISKQTMLSFCNNYLHTMGYVHPAIWFLNPNKWYRLNHAYNNPYNFGNVHSELQIILTNTKQISALISKKTLILWGVGSGDTEAEIVRIKLENESEAEVIGVDANKQFCIDFSYSLRNKLKENAKYRISYLGINDLFENVSEVLSQINIKQPRMHICLGNSIGNYVVTSDIIDIFYNNCIAGDTLLIGFQTDRHLSTIYDKYKDNFLLEDLIMTGVKSSLKLEWKLNRLKNQIEAYSGNVQVFRSKRYSPEKLASLFSKGKFELKSQIIDEYNTCLQVYGVNK